MSNKNSLSLSIIGSPIVTLIDELRRDCIVIDGNVKDMPIYLAKKLNYFYKTGLIRRTKWNSANSMARDLLNRDSEIVSDLSFFGKIKRMVFINRLEF